MIINRKSTFFLGCFIFVIPFLGFPTFWKVVFTVASGILLILLSIKISIPKKNSRPRVHKEKVTPIITESVPVVSPHNDTPEVASQIVDIKPAPKKSRVTKKSNGPVV